MTGSLASHRSHLYIGPLLAVLFGVWGMNWGLPSKERARMVLEPHQQTPEFYKKLETHRDDFYEQIGKNPWAHYGRVVQKQKPAKDITSMLSAYSSYLLRTHNGDEQATLVMISRLNPLKGQWYPCSYTYGGAYLYPLAAYLGALHVFHLIRLIPGTSYYYANPDKIGDIYVAVRFYSVIGLAIGALLIFLIGRRLAAGEIAAAASVFYVLTPTAIANTKMAKPHGWAAAWSLAAIYFALRAKEDAAMRWVVFSALCLGFGMGTALSQVAFVPFVMWACWQPRWSETLKRLIIAGCIAGAVYLATNFYLISNFQDFRDELYYTRNWYPFKVRLGAIKDFIWGAMRPSVGAALWGTSLIATACALIQKRDRRLRALAALSLVVICYVSFQVQAQQGASVSSRLVLALVALWALFSAWLFSRIPKGRWLAGVLTLVYIGMAVVHVQHFVSDRVPNDNASLAAAWIRTHLADGSIIGQHQFVPAPIHFPPLPFDRYRIYQIRSAAFQNSKEPLTAIIPSWENGTRDWLLAHNFKLVKTFAESPLQKLGLSDEWTNANFALEIYQRGKR